VNIEAMIGIRWVENEPETAEAGGSSPGEEHLLLALLEERLRDALRGFARQRHCEP
jgi:hypothetical protein